MKSFLSILTLALLTWRPALAADARLVLPDFAGLEAKASETVSITLDDALIKLAAGFLDASKPEDAAAKELIAGLTGIYVRSFTFDVDFNYPQRELEELRKQLSVPGWQRVVEARSRKEGSAVDVYLFVDRNLARGMAIIAREPREFAIVNIVGAVDLQKLHQLEGRFGIPKLELQAGESQRKSGER
jgi:Domain of unknown function (DUF4252)